MKDETKPGFTLTSSHLRLIGLCAAIGLLYGLDAGYSQLQTKIKRLRPVGAVKAVNVDQTTRKALETLELLVTRGHERPTRIEASDFDDVFSSSRYLEQLVPRRGRPLAADVVPLPPPPDYSRGMRDTYRVVSLSDNGAFLQTRGGGVRFFRFGDVLPGVRDENAKAAFAVTLVGRQDDTLLLEVNGQRFEYRPAGAS